MTTAESDLVKRSLAAFQEALDVPDDELPAWLKARRELDPDLATVVERLLRADAIGSGALPTGGLLPRPAPPPPRIGHYRITDRIGGGGMGEVFVGARDDGLFDHLVAIKRMSPSLLPDAARAMFDKERRALARLGHRHIAQLYDGGVDETGAPYLIMELVRGPGLDQFVEDRNLSVHEITAKLANVADAIQHAHQHLIVHADLKPGNILVNEAGDPKIIDFGVAQILQEAERHEVAGLYPQTPAYASPQRHAGAQPTPADDIFALGVILRDLITGQPVKPGREPTLTASAALFSGEPPEGRTREWALARARLCMGDLDAIIARACDPDPAERYPSAGELADDLRAWLDHRPLKSRRDDKPYVFRKFLRRRRLRVIAAGLAAAGLVLSLATVTVLYANADRARDAAEQRFTEVRTLAKYLLYDVYDRLENTPRTLEMRRDVAGVAQQYLQQLADTPSAQPEVKREVIEGLVRIAELQSGRRNSNLGQSPEAKANIARAEGLLAELAAEEKPTPEDLRQHIRIDLLRTSIAMGVDQDIEEAARAYADAEAGLAAYPGGPAALPELQIYALVEGADLANWQSNYALTAQRAAQVGALMDKLPPDVRSSAAMHDNLIRLRTHAGDALYYQEKLKDAEAYYIETVRLSRDWFNNHPDDMTARRLLIISLWNLGSTRLSLKKPKESLRELEEAVRLMPALIAFEPLDENNTRSDTVLRSAYAQTLVANGRVEEGLAMVREQVAVRRASVEANPDIPEYARAYAILLASEADLLVETGRKAQACPIYDEANAIFLDLQQRGRVSSFDIESGGWTLLKQSIEKHCK